MALDWSKSTRVSAWNGQTDPNEKRRGQYQQMWNPDGSMGGINFLPYDELEKQEPGVWTQKYGTPPNSTPATPQTPAPSPVSPVSPSAPSWQSPTVPIPTIGSTDEVMAKSDPTQTVEGRMNSLLGKDSSWLNLNRGNALKASNSRGLSNSTMAVKAGEAAAIAGALPIAQQDAGAYQQNLNTAQQGLISSKISGQEAAQELRRQAEQARHQADLYRLQGDVNMALQNDAQAGDLEKQADFFDKSSEQSTQDFNEASDLQAQGATETLTQSDRDFNHQSSLNAASYTQETATQESDQKWRTSEREATEEFNAGVNDAGKQQAFAAAIAPLGQQYIANRTNILMSPDFKTPADRTAALNALDTTYYSSIELTASIIGIDIDWGEGGVTGTGGNTPDINTVPTTEQGLPVAFSTLQAEHLGGVQTDLNSRAEQYWKANPNTDLSKPEQFDKFAATVLEIDPSFIATARTKWANAGSQGNFGDFLAKELVGFGWKM